MDPIEIRHAALEAALNFVGDGGPPSAVLHIAREFEQYLLVGHIPGDATVVAPVPVVQTAAAPAAEADVTNADSKA